MLQTRRACPAANRLRLAGCLCALIAVVTSASLDAYPEVRFERLSVEQGLSQSAVHALAADAEGQLWVGTQFGLDRFDGYQFSPVADGSAASQLDDAVVLSLLAAADGSIWVGTMHGIERVDSATGWVQPIDAPSGMPLPLYADTLVEDGDGGIYAATAQGLARVRTRSTAMQLLAFADSAAAPFGPMRLHVDDSRTLWVAHAGTLWRLDAATDRLQPIALPAAGGALAGGVVGWREGIAYANQNGLFLVDATGQIQSQHRPTDFGFPGDAIDNIAVGADGELWLLLPEAIVRVDPAQSQWQTLAQLPAPTAEFGDHRPLQVAVDGKGYTWLAGQFGLGVWRDGYRQIRWMRHDPDDPGSPGPTTAANGYTILIDVDGTLWVGGGLGGLSRFSPQSARFQTVRAVATGDGAHHNIVRGIVERTQAGAESLWVAFDGVGVRQFLREPDGRYRELRHFHARAAGGLRLPLDNVWGLALDPRGNGLWVANHQQLVRIDTRSGEVGWAGLPTDDEVPPVIDSLRFSRDGQFLWLASTAGLIQVELDPQREIPTLRQRWMLRKPQAREVALRLYDLLETTDGRWLLATSDGLGLVDPSSPEARLLSLEPAGDRRPSPRNQLYGLAEHPAGTWWLGTRGGGLARARMGDERGAGPALDLLWYTRENGLVDDTIYAILADTRGQLWMSSNRGLMRFDPRDASVHAYGPRDGLQDHEFSNTVAHAGGSGRFYFGGIHGLNAFTPEQVLAHPRPPRVRLSRVEVADRALEAPLGELPALAVDHDENRITIEYLGLHSQDPARVRHAYRMDGIDPDWVDAGTQRLVRYPLLPPGQYRFWLRAANPDGVWSEPHMLLQASVAPPPWRTPAAYLVYLLLAGLGVALLLWEQGWRRRQLESLVARRTHELAEQKQLVDTQAQALREALEARTTLFANVSHELRTPLTLIQAALERAGRHGADAGAIDLGRRYLQRLLRLVDQLLELSRLRQGAPTSSAPAPAWPLDPMVSLTVDSFRPLLEQRGITLVTDIERGWLCRGQQPQIERILLNLLSNAAKFTPTGGHVEVRLRGHGEQVQLVVADDGPGIPPDQQPLVFERFHRNPSVEHSRVIGAGIGLALVREATLANGGTVDLDSTPGQGSRFTVTLPAWREIATDSDDPVPGSARLELELSLLAETDAPAQTPPQRPRHSLGNLLIVEDNADLRSHIADALASDWRVLQAADGNQALELARKRSIDLIVSDIMMPGMDGIALLKALRDDDRTSHLPILLLTARQDDETRLTGLRLAADEFLVKPFAIEELKLRLKRILENRQRLQAHLLGIQRPISAPPSEKPADGESTALPIISSRDQRFLDRLNQWLETHYTDPDLTIEAMASAAAMDLRTLQRKLKTLTGRTPNAYLRDHRLAHARRLLRETDRQVTDIALSCGFGSVQYFSRVFHQQHGKGAEGWRGQREGAKV